MQSRHVKDGNLLSRDDRKLSQGFVDINNLTTGQLVELIERQQKLLQNKSFLEKLPDKGNKILSFKAELDMQLKKKQEECDTACQLLFNLSLNDKNAEDIEWNKGNLSICDRQLDSDDDDGDDDEDNDIGDKQVIINPLKYVATHSGTASGKIMKINSSDSKVPVKDLNTIKKTLYIDRYCEKYEKSSKERFKPNKLRNDDKTIFMSSAEKVKERLGNKWEITEATPPAPIYKDTVMISLSESLKLQKEQAEKLKEIQKKNATEKLLQNMSLKIGDKLPVHNVTEYRSSNHDFDGKETGDPFGENEVKDSDCEDEKYFSDNSDVEN